MRLREIERLTRELEAEKEEKVIITRKLALCEHDKKNLEISLNANKTLLGKFKIRTTVWNIEVRLYLCFAPSHFLKMYCYYFLTAESRSKISELESEVLKLKNHIKDIEKSKDEVCLFILRNSLCIM